MTKIREAFCSAAHILIVASRNALAVFMKCSKNAAVLWPGRLRFSITEAIILTYEASAARARNKAQRVLEANFAVFYMRLGRKML